MFENTFLYTAYTDDSTFFLKDQKSVNEIPNIIKYLSSFTGLKLNLSKCEIAGIAVMKGVKVAICRIKCIDLTKYIKVLQVFFSYDNNLQFENDFRKTILSIQRILKMWGRRNLTLDDKIIFIKSYFLGSSISNSKSDYRWITTNRKRFLYWIYLSRKWNVKSFVKIFNMESEKMFT